MVALARSMPGFLGVESVRGPDGFGITVSYWADEDAVRHWQQHGEHLLAQRFGRERWYTCFEVRVCRVERAYGFGRPTAMAIRKSVPADRDTLLDIWLRSVRATHAFLSEDDIQSLLPLVRDMALAELDLWVLCADTGEPVGFLGLSGAKVEALFLAPEFQRRGGGRKLLDHARQLKGPLTVDVNEQNPEAVRFYEACGFAVVGRSEVDSTGRPFPLLHMHEVTRR